MGGWSGELLRSLGGSEDPLLSLGWSEDLVLRGDAFICVVRG